jgi:uncharacterized protein YqhQ
VTEEKFRLGGMALQNGVLVHGPTSWACAVRAADGELRVASGRKHVFGAATQRPLLRGPARLLESVLVLPRLRSRLPEARLPFERPAVIGAMVVSGVAVRVVRSSRSLSPPVQELIGGLLAFAPAMLALRGGELAAYHGAEHISIGSYEHSSQARREHERCGSHLVGPLFLTSALGATLAARAPERIRRPAALAASLVAVAAATEIFGWMVRNPERPLAKALAWPGHELQHRFATAEPTADQVEVAEAALAACLELERSA